MKTTTLLALLAVTPALAGCDLLDNILGKPPKGQQNAMATQAEMHAHTEAVLGFLNEPEPEVVAEAPPAVVEPPAPPPPVLYAYDHYNADPTGYVCEPIFRQLSCLDDGTPVYLDGQMAQLPFGVHP